MDKPVLRVLIQEKLADGRLPHDHLLRMWGRPGDGQTCHGCGETVTNPQLLMEGFDAAGRKVHLHVRCLLVWDVERQVPVHAPRGPAVLARPATSRGRHN
jgi:hypothetical protein